MATKTHIVKQDESISESGLQVRTSDPNTPVANQIWLNKSTNTIKFFDGASVKQIGPVAGPVTLLGGAQQSTLAESLNAAEVSGETIVPNQILDTFNSDRGVRTNMSLANSVLKLNPGSTAGSYERQREISTPVNTVNGVAVMRLHAAAPSTIPSTTSMTLTGDLTAFFPATKSILIYKVISTDGQTRSIVLLDNANLPAKLTVSAASYNAGTDTTTLTITNPSSLDMTMGISQANFRSQLRVVPFDYSFLASAAGNSNYEEMSLTAMHGLSNISIPSEAYLTKLGNLSGKILRNDMQLSANHTYGVIRLLERTTGSNNSLWHFYYTVDSGLTWTKFDTVKTIRTNSTDDWGDSWLSNSQQIAVANNGKFFLLYTYYNLSGYYTNYAVYGDLTSSPKPALIDAAPTASSNIPGYITDFSSQHVYFQVAADPIDLSYVACGGARTDNKPYIFFWKDGGATFDATTNSFINVPAYHGIALQMSGSGLSHRTHFLTRYGSTGNYLYGGFFNQAAPTTYNQYNSHSALTPNDFYITDALTNASYLNIFGHDNTNTRMRHVYTTIGSGTFNASTILDVVNQDYYDGWNWSDTYNLKYRYGLRAISDPLNDKHQFYVANVVHPDSVRRSHLYEITDVTAMQAPIVQTATGTTVNINDTTTQAYVAQTFTPAAGSNVFRTLAFLMYQVGTIPAGSTISCEVWNTSAGVPTSIVDPTYVSQSIDASKLTTSTSGQWVYFNFTTTPVLANATTYAWVLKVTYPASASNYLKVFANTANPYAGGLQSTFNSGTSTWTNTSANDLTFMAHSEYITDVGDIGTHNGVHPYNTNRDTAETQITLIDNTTLRYAVRFSSAQADADRHRTGVFYYRNITINSGAKASIGALTVLHANPADWDANITFNVSLGNPECDSYAADTGVPSGLQDNDAGQQSIIINTRNNINQANYVYNTSFASGRCCTFNGTNQYLQYTSKNALTATTANYAVEAEIHPDFVGNGTARAIVGKWSSTAANYSWRLYIDTDGYLRFDAYTGSATLTSKASDKLEPTTYHKVRVVRSGSTVRLYRNEGVAWAEVGSYSAQITTLTTQQLGTGDLWVGYNNDLSSSYFWGRIGYIKIAVGTTSFNYEGFKPQHALVNLTMDYYRSIAERQKGNKSTYDANWEEPVILGRPSALVDSYDQVCVFSKNLSNTGRLLAYKINANRGGDRNQSSIVGVNNRFFKS